MFELLTLKDASRWQEIVCSLPRWDIHYLPQYSCLFSRRGEGAPHLLVVEKNGKTALFPFLLRRINDLPHIKSALSGELFDIISPYGLGGPLASTRDKELLSYFWEVFHRYCRENNVVSAFIRFHPLEENHIYYPDKNHLFSAGEIVYVDLELEEGEIWKGYKSNNRWSIKKALRSNVKVVIEDTPEHFEEFLNLYYHTMKRNKSSKYYYFEQDFFDRIHKHLKGHYVYAHAIAGNEIISSELLLFNSCYIHSFLLGTYESYFPLHPNNLLKHQIILWAKQKGIRKFILGGGQSYRDGIFKFKHSFSPSGIKDFVVAKIVINQEAYRSLLIDWELNKRGELYFPVYRL